MSSSVSAEIAKAIGSTRGRRVCCGHPDYVLYLLECLLIASRRFAEWRGGLLGVAVDSRRLLATTWNILDVPPACSRSPREAAILTKIMTHLAHAVWAVHPYHALGRVRNRVLCPVPSEASDRRSAAMKSLVIYEGEFGERQSAIRQA